MRGHVGEFEIIGKIKALAERRPLPPEVRLGIGDDCCLLDPGPDRELALSTDAVVEEVHFRLRWCSFRQVGIKAMASALSDLAAMAAVPLGALVTVAAPDSAGEAELLELSRALVETGARHGCALIGGDLVGSPGPLMVSVTVAGAVPRGRAVRRSGAAPGDRIWVSGAPGEAAAALAWLERSGQEPQGVAPVSSLSLPEPPDDTREKLLEPVPRLRLGLALGRLGIATAMIDISDGVAGDLGHLLKASGVGAQLEEARLPVSSFARRMATALGKPGNEFFFRGGEDYELLFTARPDAVERRREELEREGEIHLTMIGEITGRTGELALIRPDGAGQTIEQSGFEHLKHPSSSSGPLPNKEQR